jgi:hypothetical protein
MTLVWLETDKCKNCGDTKDAVGEQRGIGIRSVHYPTLKKNGDILPPLHVFVPVRVATEESVIAERKELVKKLDDIRHNGQDLQIRFCAIDGFCFMQNELKEVVRGLEKEGG